MFKICVPGWRRKKPASASIARNQQGGERSRNSAPRDNNNSSSLSTNTTTYEFSASKGETTGYNSRESQLSSTTSSSTTSSSLAGLREILPDGPILYKRREIARATENFADSHKVGARSVFRARLRGADVAIVRRKGRFVGNYAEIVRIITNVHHINLVKVLGVCNSRGENDECVYVCYEYEPGMNLGEALRGSSSRAEGYTVLQKWSSRIQVALDIALGLEYLHDHTYPTFVHKHIKSSNVLVTNDLRAKITKLGIPQLTGEIQTTSAKEEADTKGKNAVTEGQNQNRKLTRSNSLKITGTPGYMSPEYTSNGVVSSKMDVFAYGVVLLEIITGRKPGVSIDPESGKYKMVSLPEQVREVMSFGEPRKKLRLWMDPKLRDSYPVEIALSVAVLARQCVEQDPELRPPMKNVAAKLSSYLYSSLKWEQSYSAFRENQSQTMEGR